MGASLGTLLLEGWSQLHAGFTIRGFAWTRDLGWIERGYGFWQWVGGVMDNLCGTLSGY